MTSSLSTVRSREPSVSAAAHPDAAALEAVVWSMGELTAWAQLRCAGRDGAATIDDLMAFAGNAEAFRRLAALARDWAMRIERDWLAFRASPLAKWAAKAAMASREKSDM